MARKDVSAIVSGAGFAASFWTAFDKAVRDKGGGDEDIYRLGTPEGEGLIDEFVQMVVKRGQPALLELVGTVTLPELPEFSACDRFVIDTGHKAEVKISYLGDNFKEWFLKKIEEPIDATTLRYANLTKSSVDAPIRAEIGSEFEETTLAQIWSLMESQKNGEDGVLLNNECANTFYVRDVNGTLRAVDVHWDVDGWDVDAVSVGHPIAWDAGDRVFSRNS